MKIKKISKTPLCECGCGKHVTWSKRKKEWNKRLNGHYERTEGIREKIRSFQKEHSYFKLYNKTKEHSEKVKKSNSERTVTEEQKTKISNSLKGHVRSKESRLKQSITMMDSGVCKKKNNPNWKGGISARNDIGDWIKISREIKKRDNYECQACKSDMDLHVHHKDFDKNNHSPMNLITLCRTCHMQTHKRFR